MVAFRDDGEFLEMTKIMIRLDAPAFVYILTNYTKTTLYVGMTTKLAQRISDHKNGKGSAFCIRYKCNQLVFLRDFDSILAAIAFEKKLKHWRRAWKEDLIASNNPEWKDLSYDVIEI